MEEKPTRLQEIEDREETLYRYVKHPYIYMDVVWLTKKLRHYEKSLESLLEDIRGKSEN